MISHSFNWRVRTPILQLFFLLPYVSAMNISMNTTVIPQRLVDGKSAIRKAASFSVSGESVHSLRLSADGNLLAVGNDQGRLEVCINF